MSKAIKTVKEVERVIKDKVTVYEFTLTEQEVYFIHWLINRHSVASGQDSKRLQKLIDFWPIGSCFGPNYEPTSMYNKEL